MRSDIIGPIERAQSERDLMDAIDRATPVVLDMDEPESTLMALRCRLAAEERREVFRRGRANESDAMEGAGAVFWCIVLGTAALFALAFILVVA